MSTNQNGNKMTNHTDTTNQKDIKTTNQKNMEITNENGMKVTNQKDITIQTKRRANQVIKLQRETHSQLLYCQSHKYH